MLPPKPEPFALPPGLLILGEDRFPISSGRFFNTTVGGVLLPPGNGQAGRPSCYVYADLRQYVPATLARPLIRHPASGLPPTQLERIDAVFEAQTDGRPTGDHYSLTLWRPTDLPGGARPLPELASSNPERLPSLPVFERFLIGACTDLADGISSCCPHSVWADPSGLYPLYWGAFQGVIRNEGNALSDVRRLIDTYLDGWVHNHGFDGSFHDLAPPGLWESITDLSALAKAVHDGRFRFDMQALTWRVKLLRIGGIAYGLTRSRGDQPIEPKAATPGPYANKAIDQLLEEAARLVRLPGLEADLDAATNPDAALELAADWTRDGYQRWVEARIVLNRLWQAVEYIRKVAVRAERERQQADERSRSATAQAEELRRELTEQREELRRSEAQFREISMENKQLVTRNRTLAVQEAEARSQSEGLREQADQDAAKLDQIKATNRTLAGRVQKAEQKARQVQERSQVLSAAVDDLTWRAGVPLLARLAAVGFDGLLVSSTVIAIGLIWSGRVVSVDGFVCPNGVWGWWAIGFWALSGLAIRSIVSPGDWLLGIQRVKEARTGQLERADFPARLVSGMLHQGILIAALGAALGWALLPGGEQSPPPPGFLPQIWAEHVPLRGWGAVVFVSWPFVLALWVGIRLLAWDLMPWYRNTTFVEHIFGLGYIRLPIDPSGPMAALIAESARSESPGEPDEN